MGWQESCGKALQSAALGLTQRWYPSVKATHTLGFESTDFGHVARYKVIPLKASSKREPSSLLEMAEHEKARQNVNAA